MGKENETRNCYDNEIIVPKNMGRMNAPSGSAVTKGICGDTMEMYLIIDKDTINDSLFYTDGCNASRMCGSVAANLAKGKSLKETLRVSPADVIDVWKDIPQGNVHCAILSVNTLHKAIAEYLLRNRLNVDIN